MHCKGALSIIARVRAYSSMASEAAAAAPEASRRKDTKCAVAIVPPRAVWEQIQEIRIFNDKGFIRWPPHINLLYPFYGDVGGSFEELADTLAAAVRSISPFKVRLSTLQWFDHGRSSTLWLHPESEDLVKLQAGLVAAFPDCTELSQDPSRDISAFCPHLSLGQWQKAASAQQELAKTWRPVEFSVGSVCLLSRAGFMDPFRVRYEVPLGSAAEAVRVDVPYVATVGPGPSAADGKLAARYGLGALHDGVWYFAFGANLSTGKLTGSRGIEPLEALPGRLAGYHLAFNHRGAMGNLMQDGAGEVHGVLYRLRCVDFATLAHMEHEYRPTEVMVEAYDGRPSVRAVTFLSPPDMLIPEGMPPSNRYLKLLQAGAHEWKLDSNYVAWMDGLEFIDARDRGQEYYTSPAGTHIKGYHRIWTGGDTVDGWGRRQRGGGGGRRGRGGQRGGRRGGAGGRGRGG